MDNIKLINLNYNKKKLLSICNDVSLIESKHLSKYNKWQYGLIEKNKVIDLYQQIKIITGSNNIEIRYIIQKANYEVKEHTDLTHICAINIILSDNYGPSIRDGKKVYYNCALINTQKPHSIPPFNADRKILKFGILDINYEEASRTSTI